MSLAGRSAPLRVGILGAGRRRNGTGPYVARFFHRAGAHVAALVCSSAATAEAASEAFASDTGVRAAAFSSAEEMMDTCSLDAVAICSPREVHAEHLSLALDHKLHTFCEKPLLDIAAPVAAAEIIAGFAASHRVLTLCTPWVEALSELGAILTTTVRERFEMDLSPPAPGPSMIPEALPHPISLLVALGITGLAGPVSGTWARRGSQLTIEAPFRNKQGHFVDVIIRLTATANQPRPLHIVLDGTRAEREIDMTGYQVSFRVGQHVVPIRDPLERNVERFLDDVLLDKPTDAASIALQVALFERLVAALPAVPDEEKGLDG